MVTQATTRFTIYTRPELIELAGQIARENNISRSRVVTQCLEELARRRKEDLMAKCYQDMANEHSDFAQKSVDVIQKIASSWGD